MHGLILEESSFSDTKDMARHMCARMYSGKIVIVADKPTGLLSSLRKQWLQLIRDLQKQRASTLDPTRINEITGRIAHMQQTRFAATWYKGDADFDFDYDVCIATADQLHHWPPEYKTMYVTSKLDREKLFMITTWMRPGSLVVICKQVPVSRNGRP